MKTQIASKFYDKEIDVLKEVTSIDDEGGICYGTPKKIDSFKGNVSFSNCKKIQEEYGLEYQIDISITCDYRSIEKNTLVKFQDITYRITDILPSDSHVLIIGTKWQR